VQLESAVNTAGAKEGDSARPEDKWPWGVGDCVPVTLSEDVSMPIPSAIFEPRTLLQARFARRRRMNELGTKPSDDKEGAECINEAKPCVSFEEVESSKRSGEDVVASGTISLVQCCLPRDNQ
jgi:hypothetical protein